MKASDDADVDPRVDAGVESWLDARPTDQVEGVRLARDIILGADARITESIKWGVPTFSFMGDIASFTAAKRGVGLMFHRGAEIPGDHPRLAGDTKLVRTMRFADAAEIDAGRAEIEAAVRSWCTWRDAG